MYKVGDMIRVKIQKPEIAFDKIINGQTGIIKSIHKAGFAIELETKTVVLLEPDKMELKV